MANSEPPADSNVPQTRSRAGFSCGTVQIRENADKEHQVRRGDPEPPPAGSSLTDVEENMAREFAKQFYSSKAWQDCREGYAKSQRYLCENCLRRGIYKPGEIVHHMIEITPDNIYKPEISMSWDNLQLLCRDCHAEQHKKRNKGRRFVVGDDGKVHTI